MRVQVWVKRGCARVLILAYVCLCGMLSYDARVHGGHLGLDDSWIGRMQAFVSVCVCVFVCLEFQDFLGDAQKVQTPPP